MSQVNDMAQKVPFIQKAGYSLGIHGIMYFWYATNLYLFYFYTDVVGLSPAQAGTIFFVSLLWDGVTDPIMGIITDRIIARGGRYRPMILIGGIPFCLSFIAIFYVPAGVDAFVYCLIANLVFRLFWTMTYIPYTSMLTRITTNSNERASIGGMKTIFFSLAKLPVAYFVLTFVAVLGAGDEAKGFLLTMSIIACMAGLAFIGCYYLTPEHADVSQEEIKRKLNVQQIIEYFRRNSQLWIVLVGLFFASGSFGILMQSIIYYFKYNLADADSAKLAFTSIAIAGLTVVPLWMALIPKLGNRMVWFSGCVLGAISLSTLYLLPDPSVWMVTTLIFLAASGIYAFIMTFLPMVADCVDYGEWKSGYRVEAFSFGFLSLANKISIGTAGWLLGYLQTWVGFEANVEQSESTLQGLKGILTLAPAVGVTLSAIVILTYKINFNYHKHILSELGK